MVVATLTVTPTRIAQKIRPAPGMKTPASQAECTSSPQAMAGLSA